MAHVNSLPLLIIYTVTMMLGIAARYRGRSFGTWHHVLFAATCVTFIASVVLAPRWLHVPSAIVLTLLPFTRPRRARRHDVIAAIGLFMIIILVVSG
jgi:hypothetical protein